MIDDIILLTLNLIKRRSLLTSAGSARLAPVTGYGPRLGLRRPSYIFIDLFFFYLSKEEAWAWKWVEEVCFRFGEGTLHAAEDPQKAQRVAHTNGAATGRSSVKCGRPGRWIGTRRGFRGQVFFASGPLLSHLGRKPLVFWARKLLWPCVDNAA